MGGKEEQNTINISEHLKNLAEGYLEQLFKIADRNYFLSKFEYPDENCRRAIYWLCFKIRIEYSTNDIKFINYRKRSECQIKRIGKILIDNEDWFRSIRNINELKFPIIVKEWIIYQISILKIHYINLIKDDKRKD